MPHHDPVLFREIESIFIAHPRKHVVVDATLGLGGHAKMIASHMSSGSVFLGFDRDSDNLALAQKHIGKDLAPDVHLVHSSFSGLATEMDRLGIPEIDFILYDLGVSSAHYDEGERWFSLRFDGPLDMRFDRTHGKTAEDIIHTLGERELMQIFFRYADEKKALFIARAIVEHRKNHRITTTFQLAEIIRKASFDPKSALRVFQALRIAVNEEFDHIESSLEQAIARLAIGGKIAVITFHSIEDRLVKNIFASYMEDERDEVTGQTVRPARLKKTYKKPIEPTPEEIEENPRSRSAKLRVVERTF